MEQGICRTIIQKVDEGYNMTIFFTDEEIKDDNKIETILNNIKTQSLIRGV